MFECRLLGIQPQTHRGIPHLNRDSVIQVMKFRSTVLAPYSGNHRKSKKVEHENGFKL